MPISNCTPEIVIEGRAICRDYTMRSGLFSATRTIHAVKDVDFAAERGKTLAIVGESGCGKSTLARIIKLIDPATSGTLLIEGMAVDIAHQPMTKALLATVQIVFQNPYGSLNPRQKVGDVVMEPLLLNTDAPASERRERAMAMLLKVGLKA